MQLLKTRSPHISGKEHYGIIYGDVVLSLLFLLPLVFFYYNIRGITVAFISAFVCYMCDIICVKIRRKTFSFYDTSAIITGLIIAYMLPASVPYYIVIMADVFAIVIVKHPFGGTGNCIFNPACAGLAFIMLCADRDMIFKYPTPLPSPFDTGISYIGENSFTSAIEIAEALKHGGKPIYSELEIMLGNIAGPMGTTQIIVIFAIMLYLIARKSISIPIVLGYLSSCAAFAYAFPRLQSSRLESMLLELAGGSLLFGAAFIITNPSSSPKLGSSRLIYGITAGILTMLFRYYGVFSQGLVFAVLITNALTPIIETSVIKVKNSVKPHSARSSVGLSDFFGGIMQNIRQTAAKNSSLKQNFMQIDPAVRIEAAGDESRKTRETLAKQQEIQDKQLQSEDKKRQRDEILKFKAEENQLKNKLMERQKEKKSQNQNDEINYAQSNESELGIQQPESAETNDTSYNLKPEAESNIIPIPIPIPQNLDDVSQSANFPKDTELEEKSEDTFNFEALDVTEEMLKNKKRDGEQW